MARVLTPDICVIGAGAGGLVVAAGAALMGADVVLVERGRMGGDCLNFGCVPSKALLAAGEAAVAGARAAAFGIAYAPPAIDFAAVQAHVAQVIRDLAPNDSEERFRAMGVAVLKEEARFVSPREMTAGPNAIRARRFVVATGSSPLVPPISGLKEGPFLTNETVFENAVRPDHLIVIGGGAVGLELAQAHRRLGSRVSVFEMADVLPREDPEIVAQLVRALARDGVALHAKARVVEVAARKGAVVATVEMHGRTEKIEGSHLLVAAGRTPNLDLNLDAAGVAYGPGGIKVDSRLRTTNRRVFAVGDVAGREMFTHAASYHAGVVLRNILFRLPARVSDRAMPRVVYTDPELASVGLREDEARERFGKVGVLRWPFAENDRAHAENATAGLVKIVATARGRIVGAQILGARAGDLLLPWVMAVARHERLGRMAGLVVPYPTLSEAGKRAAGSFFMPALSSRRTRSLVRFLARFG